MNRRATLFDVALYAPRTKVLSYAFLILRLLKTTNRIANAPANTFIDSSWISSFELRWGIIFRDACIAALTGKQLSLSSGANWNHLCRRRLCAIEIF